MSEKRKSVLDVPRLGIQQKQRLLASGSVGTSGSASSSHAPAPSAPSVHPGGRLAKLLLTKRAWGEISASQMQEIAAAAKADGASCQLLAIIAGIGSGGRHTQNCERDLQCHLAPTPLTSSWDTFRLPFKCQFHVKTLETSILYPHQFFAALHENHQGIFVQRMCGGDGTCPTRFWAAMEKHPRMQFHPELQDKRIAGMTIPISFHGDGVPVAGIGKSWSKSVDVFSWSSCLSSGSTATKTFLIFLVHKLLTVSSEQHHTMNTFWTHLRWSFEWLEKGVWPDVNPEGAKFDPKSPEGQRALKSLAGGWRCKLWALKGDLEFFSSSLGLESYHSHTPCFLCKANTSDTPWTDFRENQAKWLSTIWSDVAWKARAGRHILFHLPGLSISSVLPDILHCKHLGTDQYYYGSVLMVLTHHILKGSKEDNLATVWAELKAQYRALGVGDQLQNLTLSMYVPEGDKFPRLKSRAAEARHLGQPLLAVFEKFMDGQDKIHRLIQMGLQYSTKLEDILDENMHDYCLNEEAHKDFLSTTYSFLAVLTSLGNHYHPQQMALFHCTIKAHYLLHIALYSRWCNPRAAWTYSNEDFMQVVRGIVAACQRGTAPALVSNKVMKKYIAGLAFVLLGDDCWR